MEEFILRIEERANHVGLHEKASFSGRQSLGLAVEKENGRLNELPHRIEVEGDGTLVLVDPRKTETGGGQIFFYDKEGQPLNVRRGFPFFYLKTGDFIGNIGTGAPFIRASAEGGSLVLSQEGCNVALPYLGVGDYGDKISVALKFLRREDVPMSEKMIRLSGLVGVELALVLLPFMIKTAAVLSDGAGGIADFFEKAEEFSLKMAQERF